MTNSNSLSEGLWLTCGCSKEAVEHPEFISFGFESIGQMVFDLFAKTRHSAGKMVENLNFLSEGLLLTCGCSKELV